MSDPGQRPRRSPAVPSPTRERLIATAVSLLERDGMTVGLDHLSLEHVIARSGVSRASAYRHWPTKQDFLRDVLVTVVRSTTLDGESPVEVADLLGLLEERRAELGSEQGRRDLVVEALRRSTHADLTRLVDSPRWRTYLALHATCQGLPEGDLREDVRVTLAASEARFTAQRAGVYARLPTLIGYRLVPPLIAPEGFEVMAAAAGALMTGLVVRSLTDPGQQDRTMRLAAFGSTREEAWSRPAYQLTALLFGYLVPDPDVHWDAAQLARSRATLEEIVRELDPARARATDHPS
ncbi:MAG: TetR/AcrR family transcriptional regulator [Kineosporiaceae bacterium]